MVLALQILINGLLNGAVYALGAVGLSLIFGVLSIVNFAQGALMMLSMYTTYWAFVLWHLNPYVGLIFVMPAFFLFGYAIQRFIINRVMTQEHSSQLLLTLGLMILIENMVLLLWGADMRSVDMNIPAVHLGPIILSSPRLVAMLFVAGLTFGLREFLYRTTLGKAIRAAADNQEGCIFVGIDLPRIFSIAFGLGVSLAAVAGTLITPFFYVDPRVGHTFLLTLFVVVVLGGLGNLWGSVAAAFIVGLAEALGVLVLPGGAKQMLPYGLFVAVLLFRPNGLFGRSSVG